MTAFNDWPIKKCLALSVSLLLALLGLIGLAALGFDIPIVRQVVAFLFLSFIPGMLVLRILRVHNVNMVESLLYSVGLSLVFVMVMGVLANFALPPLGISRPIALMPLTITVTLFSLILCIVAYIRDKDFRSVNRDNVEIEEDTGKGFRANPAPYLLAILLPLLAILGAKLVDAYHSNLLIYALVFVIVLIIGLVAFNKFIPSRLYPFMMFMMALALLYQTTLISDYLVGSDIHQEYYFAGLVVLEDGFWNASVAASVNSCLSIVMLAPVYSLLLNMDVVWLFKVVYPVLFALMPLALFRIFRLQLRPQYAFLAVAFFISLPMYTMDMAQLARQQIAELFFVLVILLIVDRRLTMIQRTILVIIFGIGVVVSHYGLGTGYAIGYLTCGVIVLVFIKSRFGRALWQRLIGKSNSLPDDLATPGAFNKRALVVIVCVGLAFMLGYYGSVASGAPLGGTNIFRGTVKTTGEQMVQVISPPGQTEVSPALYFDSPDLKSPERGSRSAELTRRLEWYAFPGATSYRLQASTDNGFINLVIDEAGITDTHYDITAGLERGTAYFWRVNASNTHGTSEWSQPWCFWTFAIPASQALTVEPPQIELPGFVQILITKFPMLNPLAKESLTQTALGLDFASASPGGKVWRIFQYLVQICLIIGFMRLVFRPATLGKFKAEYLSLIMVSMLILLSIFILPTVGWGMGVVRIWQITLLLMAPLFIFGGETIVQGIAKLARAFRRGVISLRSSYDSPTFLRCTALIILIPYFIFNSGLVFELTKSQTTNFIDMPYSIALSSCRVDVSTVFTRRDITAATWLSRVEGQDYSIYADSHGRVAFVKFFGYGEGGTLTERLAKVRPFPADMKGVVIPCYIYFRAWNVTSGMLTFPTAYAARQSVDFDDISGLPQLAESGSKIYNNGGAQVLLIDKAGDLEE
jgi:uncharacterized membrane protein